MISAPSFYPDLEADDYFADPTPTPSLRQSLIPWLERSPHHAAYRHPRLNPYGQGGESTRAQHVGSAVHRLALGKGREVSIIKYPDWKSSTARNLRDEALRNKRIPVLERDYRQAVDMAAHVRGAIEEACEGRPYETEVPLFWREPTPQGDIWCGGMLDVWCPALALIVDPKTTAKAATPEVFGGEASNNGYDLQAEFYTRGVGRILPDLAGRVAFLNLPIEKDPPHGFQLLEPSEATRYLAKRRIDTAVETWGRCLKDRAWPSYPKGRRPYSTPEYAQRRQMAAELDED